MTKSRLPVDPNDDSLYFLPLGGSDEIGMNLNLYGYAGRWLIVDLGITFGDDTTPGVDIILPDVRLLEQHRGDLAGLFLTHGHEDHIGAVPYLWSKLRCPIWCTPFTASLVRRKLDDVGLLNQVEINEVPLGEEFVIGPFELELVSMTHSIPESNLVVIRCGAGNVVHTGDWKFDPTPYIGEEPDYDALKRIGDEGVTALVGDSTNVFEPGSTGSEETVRKELTRVIGEQTGKVVVTCFASNVARLESIAVAAAACERQTALVGRSLWRMHDAAKANGYLEHAPTFISDKEAEMFPEDKVVLICTGSQGESRAALARIADNSHPGVSLGEGDVCIFSSRQIPGNELAISRIQNKLVSRGVKVITAEDEPGVHVSGHPARDDLTRMYQLLRPELLVPVHGDARHLREHAALGKACQISETIVPGNGSMIRIVGGETGIVDWYPTSSLAFDGGRLIPLQSDALQDRRRMLHNGMASVTLVADDAGSLQAEPVVTFTGLAEDEEAYDLEDEAIELIETSISGLSRKDRRNDDLLREAARRAVRRVAKMALGKRPVTEVHLVRLPD